MIPICTWSKSRSAIAKKLKIRLWIRIQSLVHNTSMAIMTLAPSAGRTPSRLEAACSLCNFPLGNVTETATYLNASSRKVICHVHSSTEWCAVWCISSVTNFQYRMIDCMHFVVWSWIDLEIHVMRIVIIGRTLRPLYLLLLGNYGNYTVQSQNLSQADLPLVMNGPPIKPKISVSCCGYLSHHTQIVPAITAEEGGRKRGPWKTYYINVASSILGLRRFWILAIENRFLFTIVGNVIVKKNQFFALENLL